MSEVEFTRNPKTGKYIANPKTDPGVLRRNKALMRLERKRYVWLGYSLLIVILDQLSKWAITELVLRSRLQNRSVGLLDWYIDPLPPMPFSGIEVLPFFNIVMVWNSGVSFGLFGGYTGLVPYFLIFVALVISGVFCMWLLETKKPFQGICYAMIIGGALGNVIDRARYGAVIDFLDFHAFGYHFPAFNVADMAVCIGVGLLIIVSLVFDIKKKRRYRERKKEAEKRAEYLYRR